MKTIAIDGPSGSGKSTIAKALSKLLNIVYLDTGAMYRGVGYYVLEQGIDPSEENKIIPILDFIDMRIDYVEGEQKVIINEKDVTPFIRENRISMAASTVSKIPSVRMKLVELQRKIASKTDCVLDGRDIGSFVLPNANFKFFLTASKEERAKRRFTELQAKGSKLSIEEIAEDMAKRDEQDSQRSFAPLIIPEGAIVIDTTSMTIEQVISTINEYVCKLN